MLDRLAVGGAGSQLYETKIDVDSLVDGLSGRHI